MSNGDRRVVRTTARVEAVSRLSKRVLAERHIRAGGVLSLREYLRWSHDELVDAVLEDWEDGWDGGGS
jgi:hypothetical protein